MINDNIILNVDWNCSLVESITDKIDLLTIEDLTFNSPEFHEANLIDFKYDIW